MLKARFATRTTADWLNRLRGRVPCAPVNDVRQALADEQVRARDMIVEVPHAEFGTLKEVRSPVRTEGEMRHPRRAPRLGEDTDAILSDILGYGDATIAGLRARGGAPPTGGRRGDPRDHRTRRRTLRRRLRTSSRSSVRRGIWRPRG